MSGSLQDEVEATIRRMEQQLNATRLTDEKDTTMTKTAVTKPSETLPMDDPSLSDSEATFASLRLILQKLDLQSARLDGLTEAVAAVASRPAAPPAPVAAPATPTVRPFTGGGGAAPVATERLTLGLVEMFERTVPKRTGGSFTVVGALFSNGYKRDVPKHLIQYFSEHIGQEVTFTQQKNAKGYYDIVSVG